MPKKLPKEILVFEEESQDENYLVAVRDADGIAEENDGCTVGVYVLQRTHKFSVKRELK